MKEMILALVAALAPLACQTPSKQRQAHALSGKPEAPVAIEADVAASAAQVRIRFEQPGAEIQIRADGVDGLSLQGDSILTHDRSVAAGAVLSFDVPFVPGSGQSMLAVRVSGSFASSASSAVRAFLVGKASVAQLQLRKAGEGTTRVGGENVHLIPVDAEAK